MSELPIEAGRRAVSIARRTMLRHLTDPDDTKVWPETREEALPPVFGEKRGLFVTLSTYPDEELRGCIGFSEPYYPLGEGIARAAFYAAREDPRFPPVGPKELSQLVIEVSILSPLERLPAKTPEDLLGSVKVGRDGLVVRDRGTSGLLLPQVPVDEGWSVEEFLQGVCRKAGLSPEAWRLPGPLFWRFTSTVFRERSPGGAVERRSELEGGN